MTLERLLLSLLLFFVMGRLQAKIPSYHQLFHLIDSSAYVGYEQTAEIRAKFGIKPQSAGDFVLRSKLNFNLARFDSSIVDARAALRKNDQEYQYAALLLISESYLYNSVYDSAYYYDMKMLRYAEQVQDRDLEAMSYAHLAKVHYYLTNIPKNRILAKEYAEKALKTKHHWPEVDASIYLFYGAVYRAEQQIETALSNLEKAVEIWTEQGMEYKLARPYVTMGHCHSFNKEFEKKLFYVTKAEAIAIKYNQLMLLQLVLTNKGEVYMELKKTDLALKCYEEALLIADSIKIPERQIVTRAHLVGIYKLLKNYEKALQYAIERYNLQNEVYSSKLPTEIAKMRVEYDIEKKEKEAELLKAKTALLESEKQRQYNFFTAVIISVFLLLLLVIAAMLLWQRRKTLAYKQALLNALLQGESQERTRIAEELHDSLGQTLIALKMNLSIVQMSATLPKEQLMPIVALTEQAVKESRNIAHALHPEAMNSLNLGQALKNICETFPKNQNTQIVYQIAEPLPTLPNHIKIHLIRILQELLNNAMKHANASKIELKLEADAQQLHLLYKDNGKGLDSEILKNAGGLGWKNIEARVLVLKGKMNFDSRLGEGFLLQIKIPVSV